MKVNQNQNGETIPNSWQEVKDQGYNAFEFIGKENHLDQATVPPHLLELHEAAAKEDELSQLEAKELEEAETRSAMAKNAIAETTTLLAVARAKREQAAPVEKVPSDPVETFAIPGSYSTGGLSSDEHQDMLQRRRDGIPQ